MATFNTPDQIRHLLNQSISLALLCSLDPAGVSFETYKQKLGIVKYTGLEYRTEEIASFISSPLHLASEVLPTLSDLIAYEMSFQHGLGSDGWLEILATYPFLFTSFALHNDTDTSENPSWELISDLTFTHFIMFGGRTGIGNDIIGYVISQESQPGVILESSAFQTSSSVIAPGYSIDQIKVIKAKEDQCLKRLMKNRKSVLSSFVEEINTLGTSGAYLKFLYGVSTTPFNNIDKVITHLRRSRVQKSNQEK